LTPIFVTTAGPATRQQVSDALRAGANSVWADPIDTEEFLLRLDGQLQTKFAADRAREEGLLDHQTGLYNTQGLERRARELASHVDRRGAALACVVLAPDATTDVDATIESLGRILRSVGRGSDTIGRVGRRELVVLAPYRIELEHEADGHVGRGRRRTDGVERVARRAREELPVAAVSRRPRRNLVQHLPGDGELRWLERRGDRVERLSLIGRRLPLQRLSAVAAHRVDVVDS